MPNVIFVAPFFMNTTLRFVSAAARLPGVRLALISQDPIEKLPRDLMDALHVHKRVDDALDVTRIAAAVRSIGRELGSVDRILGTLEELQVPLAEVRAMFGIRGMDIEAAKNFRDKSRMKDVLQRAGLPCARHCLVSNVEDGVAFAREIGLPLVVKPPAGSGARATFRVETIDELQKGLAAFEPSKQKPVLLEEFMQGTEHSFDSVCVNRQLVFYSISRYFPTPLQVLENPWIQWVVMLPREIQTPEFADIRVTAERVLHTLGMHTGISHMEWFRRKDGSIAISEVAARPPGAQFTTLLSYAHDVDFYRAWAHLMVYEEFPVPERKCAAGIVFLRAMGAGRVKSVTGVEDANRAVGGIVVESKLPQTGQSTSGTYEGEGYVIVRHPETTVVESALATLVRTLKVELE
jgi:biotin carboxylase